VLDWEISTLGHPLSDLAYFLAAWHTPAEMGGLRTEPPPGTPSEETLLELYAAVRGAPAAPPRVRAFFRTLMWQRKAAIAHGVYARALRGNAAASDASHYGQAFCAMVALGVEAMHELQRDEGGGEGGGERGGGGARAPAARL